MKAKMSLLCALLFINGAIHAYPLGSDCSNFNGVNGCKSGVATTNPDDWSSRRFQTPAPGDGAWTPGFQTYHSLQAYASMTYSSDRQSAEVTVRAFTKSTCTSLQYSFDGSSYVQSPTFSVDSSFRRPLKITISGSDGSTLVLEDLDFVWTAPVVDQPANYQNGQKGAIVELFGWPYDDIAKECAALGQMGYMGVKIFPPQEAVLSWDQLQNNELNPWYFIYQPVSYRLHSRWGTRNQLRDMIYTCRKHNVRVYADAVVNHMTGNGNDVFSSHRNGGSGNCNYWGAKNSSAYSPYYSQGFAYQNVSSTNQPPGMEFPAVPYGPLDFHCERSLTSWNDPFLLNNGWLEGLSDLNTESDYVRDRIAMYLTDLLSIGFSGFRMDAAKHIAPESLSAIFARLKTQMGGGDLPADFITWLEVIIGGEKDLLYCQPGPYNFGQSFAEALHKSGLSDSDVNKIKMWSSDYPKEFPICGSWVIPSERFVVQNDCHDDQFPGSSSRDMGDAGSVLVKERNVDKHRRFEESLFQRTDGSWKIRLVLSSYTFQDNAFGPPDGLSDCALCRGQYCNNCKSVPKSVAHDPTACGYTVFDSTGAWAKGVYTRVHRDLGVIRAMRGWMGLPDASNEQLGLPSHCSIQLKPSDSEHEPAVASS
eukprot:GILJ01003955.1.p1 GENE.GILJ01003955.1~~GILJ01003955.1.p1  ORF type:complete len:647 (-),score=79.81 GILJ01003955.1:225-2165(-)